MIKAFLTASHIFTIIKQFGELSDEVYMCITSIITREINIVFTTD